MRHQGLWPDSAGLLIVTALQRLQHEQEKTLNFHRPAPIVAFAMAALGPAMVITAGAIWGGFWLWAGLIWVGAASQIVDTLAARSFPDPAEGAPTLGADTVSVLVALAHFGLLGSVLTAFAGDWLSGAERVGLFLSAGMYMGQVSNANAHELIHRGARGLFRLGAAVYVTLLFGHHVSAHRLVHHWHVATDLDPNSARQGESFWRFFPRAWTGSFRAGLAAERALSARQPGRLNPYLVWVGGGLVCCVLVWAAFGPWVLLDYLLLCLYAQMQLLLSDYVQHYGLRRGMRNGRPEPVGPRHSWDSPHFLSSLSMLNAPRHSDHHAHPSRVYPALRLARAGHPRPMLPYSLPVMGAIAMVPPLWRRIMDRRVVRMRAG